MDRNLKMGPYVDKKIGKCDLEVTKTSKKRAYKVSDPSSPFIRSYPTGKVVTNRSKKNTTKEFASLKVVNHESINSNNKIAKNQDLTKYAICNNYL